MSDESICLVRGSINIDEFYDLPTIVRPGQTISARNFSKRLGGKGANQARAAASAGARVLLDAAVGQGVEGESVKKELCAAVKGVEDIGVTFENDEKAEGSILGERIRVWSDGSTGKAIIQRAEDGENSIIILAGANASLPSKPYTPLIPQNSTHLLLANEIPLDETLAYLRAAASQTNVTTIYNPSPMPTGPQLAAFPWNCVGWLIVNEGELGDIAKAVFGESLEEGSEGDVKDAVEYLTKKKEEDGKKTLEAATVVAKALHTALPRLSSKSNDNDNKTNPDAAVVNIICTLGASGVLYVRSSSTSQAGTDAKCLPAAKLLRPIRDTTGAGDCFMGFLAAGLMRLREENGDDAEDRFEGVLKRCLTACSMCVENEGAQDSYPTMAQVEARLAKNPIS
ncbi:hypothetical protein QFC21_002553 [Naganishia friedmannii]|uniref:Uncharacterized protein n=1 Tax=Naganishia friedmannii TaxID=89922 RepID=A0ACC2VVI7_9TREE|nr:hypothetical protein QFC21_002553 [Naganishia friedmannii]